jgi:hypothetical protein
VHMGGLTLQMPGAKVADGCEYETETPSMRLRLRGVTQAVIAMRQQKEEEERRKLAEQQR